MNAEFHYYAVCYLCLKAGFDEEESRSIAFSSQYVDNAIHEYEVDDGGFDYITQVTQNYVFWDETTLRQIYLPFHFIPGEEERAAAERLDGRATRWTVTPDSPIVKQLLVAALRSSNPFRIGVALHSYADSWAHQHFSGRMEEGNVVDPASPLPPAGHLQALRNPDDAGGRWTDPRLKDGYSSIVNSERFLAAARKIYRYLCTYRRRAFADEELVLSSLGSLWSKGGDMQTRLADFTIELDVMPYERREWLSLAGIDDETSEEGPFAGYDKFLWLRKELAHRAGLGSGARRVNTKGRFRNSALHRWNEAAREHRALALSILSSQGLA